jgi:hypothetical protein
MPFMSKRWVPLQEEILEALHERAEIHGRSSDEELLLAARCAFSVALGSFAGQAFTPVEWKRKLRQKVNQLITTDLLGPHRGQYKGKAPLLLTEISFELPDPVEDKANVIVDRCAIEAALCELRKLPLSPLERQLVELRLVEDLTDEQAGERLGIKSGTVASLMSRIRKKAKKNSKLM